MTAPTYLADSLLAQDRSNDLSRHIDLYGARPPADGSLVDAVVRSGLLGHGGAAFPTGAKMRSISGRKSVLIANGAEGEPLSSKDRVLLDRSVHLILDGIAATAAALRCSDCYLYAPADSIADVRAAIDERRSSGWDRTAVQVLPSAAGFVSGEKSAVISAIEGGPALPRDKKNRASVAGVRERPTLVLNVETYAHIALIERLGPQWFRSRGTASEPGTMLVTYSGAVRRPGVVEVPLGTAIEEMLTHGAGVDLRSVRAVLLGGFHGTWASRDDLIGRSMSQESLAHIGSRPGAGIVHVLGAGSCGLSATAEFARYLAGESAGQCGPCLNGLPRLADAFSRLAIGQDVDVAIGEIARYTALVDGRGACHHPDGTARLIRSAMSVFAHDVHLHRLGSCEIHRGGTR
ncbi:NADH-quinone oxidoreductase subunit F [Rhodococcus sp. 06-412-2C]|uniref:NADH-ubiquinone oxidoreductase-F iron-sulfur binding region domain-containing protein n=1 Tax=unclassified Rhodococcus (in: high G+C Gram-positive bacteria) TaxID=192944 RepID=UPI000B9C70E3|nr:MULTISPECIES: NADH-ubiquinone oxidoreductase-F iron-sulfur binding region domain-containing protein [unclassified Rhodococcus (in: high G+C Gram-positive bacteria)]OZC89082.1 NADH-quinone oxidoreductase subunit F [Rhodococcus sp. 06-412-2C]OZC99735.1 NADH-quinone oxidoreductase subunit F [Rhodococcus sp. 06-412-2B]